MNYATTEEFELCVGAQETLELTNLDNPAAVEINTPRLEQTIAFASREIDGYLATRYNTPLATIPGYIKQFCIDIAWYRLAQNNAPEAFSARYNNAIARLKDIEKGIMLLIDDTGASLPRRDVEKTLTDERGQPLNDWSPSILGEPAIFTRQSLGFMDIYRPRP